MNKSNFLTMASGALHKAGFKFQKHSPEVLVGVGVVGVVVSTVLACKATLKLSGIIEAHKKTVEQIHDVADKASIQQASDPDNALDYSQDDMKKDLTITYIQTGVKVVRLYAPSIALGVLSVTSILASHNILRKRNVALAAAYATVDKGFKEYRGRVIERFGERVDHELKHNIKAVDITETVTDEKTGEPKEVKKTIDVATWEDLGYSQYARFFDEGCKSWEKNAEYNLMFLRSEQQYANDRLKSRGFLFLNEVYERLGIEPTKAGQVVGWIYDPKNSVGDNYVDFGIYDVHRKSNRAFVNGYERCILLDFNVDGDILNRI